MKYSVIVPVYNRPDEVDELLDSLCKQTFTDFEVIIVEDGSSVTCSTVVEKYNEHLNIQYFEKPNSGPGQTRNYGVERAQGEWMIVLDSDVVLPENYFAAIETELTEQPCDAFGGPDKAHPSFTPTQKAINYAMTSFFTTGGIRGKKNKMDKFYPRSFNMGIKRDVYLKLNGFSEMRFGEDIDFSTRIMKSGFSTRLFTEAWVWHKRRTDLRKFFKQVHNSGIARIHLTKRHPGTLKLVYLLPSIFTIGVVLCLLSSIIGFALPVLGYLGISPLILFSALIFIDSFFCEKSLKVSFIAILASFVQLLGYGTGFIRAWWKECVMGQGEFEAFKKNFYK
ncbi:MAG: glycosyltransferase [Bacteroidaceae bacterium]|nr:glycosyltransferase [Bacteroidaceae bacterium]